MNVTYYQFFTVLPQRLKSQRDYAKERDQQQQEYPGDVTFIVPKVRNHEERQRPIPEARSLSYSYQYPLKTSAKLRAKFALPLQPWPLHKVLLFGLHPPYQWCKLIIETVHLITIDCLLEQVYLKTNVLCILNRNNLFQDKCVLLGHLSVSNKLEFFTLKELNEPTKI